MGTSKMSGVVTASSGVIDQRIELGFAILAGSWGLNWIRRASNSEMSSSWNFQTSNRGWFGEESKLKRVL